MWAAPSGSASESTLQGGFSLLHKDNVDLLSGVSLLNQSINAQTVMVTNQLGQISIWTRSNNDAMWQMVRALTNPAASSLSLTNYATETTQTNLLSAVRDVYAGVTNLVYGLLFPSASSNLVDFVSTNGPDIETNFGNYVSTFTNTLDGYQNSYEGYTNLDAAIAASQAVSEQSGLKVYEDKFTELLDGITDFSSEIYDYWPEVDMTFDFSDYMGSGPHLMSSGGNRWDLDPLHTDWGAELFAFVRRIMMWLIAFWFLMKITEDAWKVILVITDSSNINASSVRSVVKKTSQGL